MATPTIDPRADYRARLLTEFLGARGDLAAEARILAAATRYDQANPGEPSLRDELCATTAAKAVAA